MGDGAITLWDVKKIMGDGKWLANVDEPVKMGKGCVSAVNIHSGVEVKSIQFNPMKKNLLASGGAEVLI